MLAMLDRIWSAMPFLMPANLDGRGRRGDARRELGGGLRVGICPNVGLGDSRAAGRDVRYVDFQG